MRLIRRYLATALVMAPLSLSVWDANAQSDGERVEDMWATMHGVLVNGADPQSASSHWHCDIPHLEEGNSNDFAFAFQFHEDGSVRIKSSQAEQSTNWSWLEDEMFPTIRLDSALDIHPFTTYYSGTIDTIPMWTNRDDEFIPTLDTDAILDTARDAGFEGFYECQLRQGAIALPVNDSSRNLSTGGAFQSRRRGTERGSGTGGVATPSGTEQQPSVVTSPPADTDEATDNAANSRAPVKLPGVLAKRQQTDVVTQFLINGENEDDEQTTLWGCEWMSAGGKPISDFIMIILQDGSLQFVRGESIEYMQWNALAAAPDADLTLQNSPGAGQFRDVLGDGQWSLKFSNMDGSEVDVAFAGAGKIDFSEFAQNYRIHCGLYDLDGNPVER